MDNSFFSSSVNGLDILEENPSPRGKIVFFKFRRKTKIAEIDCLHAPFSPSPNTHHKVSSPSNVIHRIVRLLYIA